MPGIWALSEPLNGTSFADSSVVAQIVFQFMFLGGLLFGIYRLSSISKSIRNGLQSIRYSTYALVLWVFPVPVNAYYTLSNNYVSLGGTSLQY
jgi:hypothetical protein